MPYKYKDEILEDIEMEPNANFDIESERYYQKLEELDEVYRKAEAFDEIKDYLSRPSPIDEDRGEIQKIIDEYDKEVSE